MTVIKITRDILTSYFNCKYKAYLKIAGQRGTPSGYETLLSDIKQGLAERATEKILAQTENREVLRHQPLTRHLLKQAALYILDATAEDNDLSLHFDGLKRIDGSSKAGAFHYIPLLFHGAETLRQQEKSLLAFYGYFLASKSSFRFLSVPQKHACRRIKLVRGKDRKNKRIVIENRMIDIIEA